ncbi:MAG TPA: DoxX family protein [Flavisolibacter sp.]|jgi:putative oxidoreductase|nr:DoxX family protein [Flavisolibacter sp.]
MKQLSFFFRTGEHLTGFILRITLALVMLPHGCQLLLGWFGGFGFSSTMQYFTEVLGLPSVVAFSVILLESIGALFILLGFMSRFFSFAMAILFIGMIWTSHWQYGFFMNWMGNQKGEGYEFHLLAIGLSIAIFVSGAGVFSLDAWFTKKSNTQPSSFDLSKSYV